MSGQRKSHLTYRPDVDGLRAVAVLLVLFDHLHTRITGGYIGVDVFFVISGYLISSLILSEMDSGTFSLVNFYERRARRILPALLAMLLGAAVLTWLYFLPSETEDFAKSMLAALFSVSNFLFWHQAGYFDAPSALKPLLHTWSLAVEEQFYLFFPLFLLVIRRWFPSRFKIAIWTIAVLTFTLACMAVVRDPDAAFYFAPLRAWELLIGAILSQRYVPAVNGRWQRNVAALAGLLLILVPAVSYSATTHFPGLAALPPCLGAALLIGAGETGSSAVGRLLAWRPVAFIGLISYSLYLWHWPIIVFLVRRDFIISTPSREFKLTVLLWSLLAATLSWYFVERPFRQGRFRPGRRALFQVTGLGIAVMAVLAVFMVTSGGLPFRYSSEALAVDSYTNYDSSSAFRKNQCFLDPPTTAGGATFANFNKAVCLADDPTRKHYLLIGDSHAAHLYYGLRAIFPELNISQATAAGCQPFLPNPAKNDNYCAAMYGYIYGDYLVHHHVDAVLISEQWIEDQFPELERTVAWFQQRNIEVILFGPAIEFDFPLPRLLAISIRDHSLATIGQHRSIEPMSLDRKLAEIARNRWKVRYISEYEDLCSVRTEKVEQGWRSSGCPIFAARGVPLLFDRHHLTPPGSILYAQAMKTLHQIP